MVKFLLSPFKWILSILFFLLVIVIALSFFSGGEISAKKVFLAGKKTATMAATKTSQALKYYVDQPSYGEYTWNKIVDSAESLKNSSIAGAQYLAKKAVDSVFSPLGFASLLALGVYWRVHG